MPKVQVVFGVLLMIFGTLGYFKQGNILFMCTNATIDTRYVTLLSMTRGRLGFSMVAITKEKGSFIDSFVLGYHVSNNKLDQFKLVGNNDTIANPILDPQNFYSIANPDLNSYPIGRHTNDILLNTSISRQYLIDNFPSPFWVYVGFNWQSPPNLPSQITTNFNDSTGESAWFEVQVQNLRPDFNLEYDTLRWEIFHVSLFVIGLLFYMIVFLLLCLYSQQHPLNTRGVIPYVSVILQFVQLFAGFPHFYLTLSDYALVCIPFYFFQRAIVLTLVYLSLVSYYRCITLFNLNRRKLNLIQNFRTNIRETRFFNILKRTLSWSVVVSSIIVVYLIICGVLLREYLLDNFHCNKRDYEQVVFTGFVIGFGFLGILLLGYDLLSSFDKIRRLRWLDLLRNDYSYHRFEMYLIGFGGALTFWIVTQAVPTQSPFWEGMFNSFALHFLFLFNTFFVLLVTIAHDFYSRFSRNFNVCLEDVLNNAECRFFFYHYAKNVYCGEYNMCLEEISVFKKESNFDERFRIVNRIYDLYLRGFRSELEISIKRSTCQGIRTRIKNNNIDDATFDQVEAEIKTFLNKLMNRFFLTRRWHKLNKKYFEKIDVAV